MIWIDITGVLLIALIVWWFWIYTPSSEKLDKDLVVVVDKGVYSPAHLSVPANREVTIQFLRRDPSPCAEWVIFPSLDISETLPVGKHKTVSLPALTTGSYPFHCQMKMYTGELKVE